MKKRNQPLLVLLLLLGLASAVKVNAQTERLAKFDKATNVISLDEKVPFGDMYQLNFKDMNFASKEKAEAFFSAYTSNLVSFSINFDKRMADMILDLRAQPKWGPQDWNKYLAGLPKK